ncbi:MAG: patatin-like phospholipase family protein [Candidatus Omnitrophica bacterium]|nr:patatin-like phospholipase family protein [Candidatus Omnitrophota bacterium]
MFLIRKIDANKSFILNSAAIFSRLRRSQKNLIAKKSEVVSYKKGDLIYRQNDPSNAFYCVISGRVKIFRSKDSRQEDLESLTSGMYFGILSILTADAHSVSAQAINDSLILKINKDDFNFILKKIPGLAIDLSTALSQQVKKRYHAASDLTSHIISVYSAVRGIGRTMYSINLAISLKKETKKKTIFVEISHSGRDVLDILNIESMPQPINLKSPLLQKDLINKLIIKNPELGIDSLNIAYGADMNVSISNINFILSLLTEEYKYVIVDLPIERTEAVFKALAQSDDIHLITDYDLGNLKLTRELMADLFKNVEYPQEKIKIIVNEKKDSQKITHEEIMRILDHGIFANIPVFWQASDKISQESIKVVLTDPNSEYAKAVRRVSRQIGNVLVGVALGSGAAFGLAQIGVIKVLERENIPVDVVAGTSIGALIGALWASGKNAQEIENIMMEFNKNKRKVFRLLFDFSLSKASLVEGKRLTEFFKKHLGDKTFYDIKMPLKIVACDLYRRQKVILDSGDLTNAVKSSVAIPGIFRPIKSQDGLIVDGGIIEPLPVETLVDLEIKKIIAVNVLPTPQDLQEGYKIRKDNLEKERQEVENKNIIARIIYNLRLFFRKNFFPNIFDIMVKSILAMEYAIAKESCKNANIIINPIISGTEWYDFFKTDTLIKKGETDTEKALPKIKALIEG